MCWTTRLTNCIRNRCLFFSFCSGETQADDTRAISHRAENSESEFCSGLQRATSQHRSWSWASPPAPVQSRGRNTPSPPIIKNTRIIARNHYSQIPPRKNLYPGMKSTQNGQSWAHHGLFLTTDYNVWFFDIIKSLDFRGFDSSRLLSLRGGNSHVR